MLFYNGSVQDVLKHFETNEELGLKSNNAQRLLKEFGENKLREKKKKTKHILLYQIILPIQYFQTILQKY